MKEIISLTNPEIKKIVKLRDDAKERKISQLCIVEGLRAISAFMTSDYPLEMLYAEYTQQEYAAGLCPQNKITLVSSTIMEKISAAKSPSGLLAIFSTKRHNIPVLQHGIVLANITDPGNMGTIIRTAVALNTPSIVIVEGCDPFSPKVIQSTAGIIAHAPLIQLSWQELITQTTVPLCALVPQGGKHPSQLHLKECFLVVGNEAHGLPKEWIADCSMSLTLPMPGKAESLNAAIAASIALYLTVC